MYEKHTKNNDFEPLPRRRPAPPGDDRRRPVTPGGARSEIKLSGAGGRGRRERSLVGERREIGAEKRGGK